MGSHTHLTLQQPALTKFSKISKSSENWETTVTTTYHVIHFWSFRYHLQVPRTVVKSYTIWAAVLSFSANVSCVRVKFARYNTNNTSCKKIHKTPQQWNSNQICHHTVMYACPAFINQLLKPHCLLLSLLGEWYYCCSFGIMWSEDEIGWNK